MEEIINIYQFTCAKTVVNQGAMQTQQVKEVIFGKAVTMAQAVQDFEEFAKTSNGKLELMGVGLVGALSF